MSEEDVVVRILRVAAVVLALLTGVLTPGGPARAAVPVRACAQPAAGRSFPTATPAAERMDAAALDRAVREFAVRARLSIQVFRHGCLVAKGPLNPLADGAHNNLWSVTKSVVSLAAGIAVGDGRLRLSDPIGRYLPTGPGWGDAAHRRITVLQLLQQRSGLDQAILAEAVSTGADPNLAREALAQPFVHPAGSTFQYSQLGPALLAYVVQRAVGEDLQTFVQRRLFGPIGIERGSYFWMRDRSGLTYGYSHLFLTPVQLARLGLLVSNDGRWRGRQIVPAAYVDRVSAPSPTNGCYGLLFWTNAGTPCTGADIPAAQTVPHRMVPSAPADMYEMNGTGGQLVIVIPSLAITVVTTGYFGDLYPDPSILVGATPGDMQYTFLRALMQSIEDVHVPDPGPYPGEQISFDVDPRHYADPRVLLRDLAADPSCNVLVCDGTVPTRGLVQDLQAMPGLL